MTAGKWRCAPGIPAVALCGLLSGPRAFSETSKAENALERFVRESSADLSAGLTTSYLWAFVDLNGDSKDEAIVYLPGSAWCGSGGCTLLVLRRTGEGYRLLTTVPIAQLPIRVLATKTNGWRDLGVYVRGGGIQRGYEARLRFGKSSYPRNPAVPPAEPLAAKVAGQVLISDKTVWRELDKH